jgi:dihydrofolate reductase
MGKLIVSVQMTLDGVMDHIDDWFNAEGESEEFGREQVFAADALLLGRKTYEGLAGVWPSIPDTDGFSNRVNGMPKFVASRTLKEPLTWNATLIQGDLALRIPELKRQHTGNLISYGCGELAYYLTTQGLADELQYWIHSFVLGDGVRPFHGLGPVSLHLKSTTMFRSGVALLCYKPEPS